ncbi:MAG: hypothetical protein DRP11_01805 [Candidatus Aenigmatarchaeota archaeon]|nr:MAG: hypothetical protein DRP11_01805 [Candidatus Aenigmarchaeota archaeon]
MERNLLNEAADTFRKLKKEVREREKERITNPPEINPYAREFVYEIAKNHGLPEGRQEEQMTYLAQKSVRYFRALDSIGEECCSIEDVAKELVWAPVYVAEAIGFCERAGYVEECEKGYSYRLTEKGRELVENTDFLEVQLQALQEIPMSIRITEEVRKLTEKPWTRRRRGPTDLSWPPI